MEYLMMDLLRDLVSPYKFKKRCNFLSNATSTIELYTMTTVYYVESVWPNGWGRKLESVRLGVRFPGQVMILGRNGTDDQDEQVEGLIAGAVVANTNVASAHPRPMSIHQ